MAQGFRSRAFPAIFTVLSALAVLLPSGSAAFAIVGAPILYPDAEGGELHLQVAPSCESTFAPARGGCHRNATAAVTYADGTARNATLHHRGLWHEGTVQLEQARATLRIQSDQGEWTRQLYIPRGMGVLTTIYADSPPTVPGLLGIDRTHLILVAPGVIAGLVLALASAIWLATGSHQSGRATLLLLNLAVFANVVVFLALLLMHFRAAMAVFIWFLIIGAWLLLLRGETERWVRGALQERASGDAPPPPAEEAHQGPSIGS